MSGAEKKTARVLYVEGNLDGTVGGSYFSLMYLVKNLDTSEFRPKVVFRRESPATALFRESGIDVEIVPLPFPTKLHVPSGLPDFVAGFVRPIVSIVQSAVNFFRYVPLEAWRLWRYLQRQDVALVHLNNSVARNNEWMVAALLSRTPCITHERGINSHYPPLSRFLARRLSGVICISRAVKDSLDAGRVRPKNVEVIYNGIDPAELVVQQDAARLRESLSVSAAAAVIGIIGNIKEWKGQETLLRAMPQILQKHPDTVCLLVGETAPTDDYYRQRLSEIVEQLNLSDNVRFVGYVANVADQLALLDVMVHTSVSPEPFGRVLIEGMSMNKPVVASNAGGVPEIVLDGTTGLLFAPGNASELAAAVNELLDDPGKAHAMAGRGRERVDETFHIRINVQRTCGFYREILGKTES